MMIMSERRETQKICCVVVDNNFRNFAPSGNVVASVPTGTGIMILATSDVEIYNNKIYLSQSFSIISHF